MRAWKWMRGCWPGGTEARVSSGEEARIRASTQAGAGAGPTHARAGAGASGMEAQAGWGARMLDGDEVEDERAGAAREQESSGVGGCWCRGNARAEGAEIPLVGWSCTGGSRGLASRMEETVVETGTGDPYPVTRLERSLAWPKS